MCMLVTLLLGFETMPCVNIELVKEVVPYGSGMEWRNGFGRGCHCGKAYISKGRRIIFFQITLAGLPFVSCLYSLS